MTLLSLDEIKEIELSILLEIDDICRQQHFNYSLIEGSLLGAVRHSGFIPWDDDIDIAMPRHDYECFLDYCENNPTVFALYSSRSDECWHLFSKAYSQNTIICDKNDHDNDVGLGVHVDIFPVDGLANSLIFAKVRYCEFFFFRELLVAKNWKKYYLSHTRSVKYEIIRFIVYILSRFVSASFLKRIIVNNMQKHSFGDKKYAAMIPSAYRMKEIIPRAIYEDLIDIEFEKHSFKAIKNYDYFLTTIYGDYMTLPSPDKRVPRHTFNAYLKEEYNEEYK